MNKSTRYIVLGSIILVLVGLFVWYKAVPGKYDKLAMCLQEKGATFYGAFWCPHCQTQKQLFGKSASKLPYVECSTPDGKGQLQVCIDAEISSYPSWVYPDGTIETGEKTPQYLADKVSCSIE